jgi:hypothetical protein
MYSEVRRNIFKKQQSRCPLLHIPQSNSEDRNPECRAICNLMCVCTTINEATSEIATNMQAERFDRLLHHI